MRLGPDSSSLGHGARMFRVIGSGMMSCMGRAVMFRVMSSMMSTMVTSMMTSWPITEGEAGKCCHKQKAEHDVDTVTVKSGLSLRRGPGPVYIASVLCTPVQCTVILTRLQDTAQAAQPVSEVKGEISVSYMSHEQPTLAPASKAAPHTNTQSRQDLLNVGISSQ